MEIHEALPCPAGFTRGAGIPGERVITLRIDDDHRLAPEDCLGDEQIEQACLADTGRADDQGVPDQVGEFRIEIVFGSEAVDPVGALGLLGGLAERPDDAE